MERSATSTYDRRVLSGSALRPAYVAGLAFAALGIIALARRREAPRAALTSS
jgi:hypothetical protein